MSREGPTPITVSRLFQGQEPLAFPKPKKNDVQLISIRPSPSGFLSGLLPVPSLDLSPVFRRITFVASVVCRLMDDMVTDSLAHVLLFTGPAFD